MVKRIEKLNIWEWNRKSHLETDNRHLRIIYQFYYLLNEMLKWDERKWDRCEISCEMFLQQMLQTTFIDRRHLQQVLKWPSIRVVIIRWFERWFEKYCKKHKLVVLCVIKYLNTESLTVNFTSNVYALNITKSQHCLLYFHNFKS